MRAFVGIAANAGYVLAVQVLALVTLAPTAYGAFSVQYLLFALASSIALSAVGEAWTRAEAQGAVRGSWAEYGNIAVLLALTSGVATVVVSLCVPVLAPVAVVGGIGVAASVFRTSARFYSMRVGERMGVVPGDLAGLLVTVGVWGGFMVAGDRSLWMMVLAWSAGAIASALVSKWPSRLSIPSAIFWVRSRRDQIRPLLRDSLLLDAGAIGTPYLLAPLLGLANFGIYRAVSNVAAPVRLVLNPIRPKIASTSFSSSLSRRRMSAVIAGSVAFGIAAYVALALIGNLTTNLGALAALADFAIPTALFVAANFTGTYLMIVARAHLLDHALLVGRILHTAVAVAFPIVGVLVAGLAGAIWGYALCTVVWSVVWSTLIRLQRRGA